MANGNVKTYLTGTQNELKELAVEGIDLVKADAADFPLTPEAQSYLDNAETLLQNQKYLEAITETAMVFLSMWGASQQRIGEIRKELSDLATQILNQVKQMVAVPDEKRVVQAIATDMLGSYMWGITDGPLSITTSLTQLAAGEPNWTADYVTAIKEALVTP